MRSDVTKRPNYRDGQYLGARDFVAEQDYHRDLRRRHNLGPHIWGIFAGLELLEKLQTGDPNAVDVYISPGFAVDGFGREIVVYAPLKLDRAAVADVEREWVTVWLRYAMEQTDPPRYGYERCDDPDLAYRTKETYRVEFGDLKRPHDELYVAGRPALAGEVPFDQSVPHQGLPDDAEQARWLVCLGRVHWDRDNATFVPLPPVPPDTNTAARAKELADRAMGRRHGGVVAAHVLAPGGRLTIRDRATLSPIAAADAGVTVTVEGSLGVRTSTPDSPLAVRATGTDEDLISFEDSGGHTTWQINQNPGGSHPGLHIAEVGFATGRLFLKAGGNVGIGTTEPRRALHVEGMEIHSGGAQAGFSFASRPAGGFNEHPGDSGERWVLYARDGTARLWSGGDKLSVTPYGDLTIESGLVVDHDNENDGTITRDIPFPGMTFGLDSGEGIGSKRTAGGNQYGLDFYTNFRRRMTITQQGSVGIGTANPSRLLHVEGSEIHSGGDNAGFSFADRQAAGFVNSPANGERWVWYAENGTARLWSGQNTLAVTTSGGLGVDQTGLNNGTISPGISFGAGSGEGIASKRTAGGNRYGLDFYTGFAQRMTITQAGRVGIGTTTPVAPLQVVGEIRCTSLTVSGGLKLFMIEHPLDRERQLVHASLEGPEVAVFYRGESQLDGGKVTVELPAYFEALTRPEGRTVQVTAKDSGDGPVAVLAASEVRDGAFTVRAAGRAHATQAFYWEVKAVRADIDPLAVEQEQPR